ncbi:MAG: phosphoribosylformylglycinamidine synthase, partial [Elusimicrobia bacterium]|nr:phosphoribosylformylglycinamidine synthase [Elusimicrobiota bacterium]
RIAVSPFAAARKKIRIGKKSGDLLLRVLSDFNVASKEEVIRQYDHEVQGSSVLKPLSGETQDIPQDGCVIRPLFETFEGIAVGLGINPFYGKRDPFLMAESNCEEAARNVVSAGGDITSAAFLDNFCWADVSNERILGALVEAARGCCCAGMALEIPFISGKDSLNNFHISENPRRRENIPGTLLITCLAKVSDVRKIPGNGFKKAGNLIYLVGETYPELGGSVAARILKKAGGEVPRLRKEFSRRILLGIQKAIEKKIPRAVHDLSDGGFAAAISEMCFSGFGASVDLSCLKKCGDGNEKLFSESNSRFLAEVPPAQADKFEKFFAGVSCYKIGRVTDDELLRVTDGGKTLLAEKTEVLKKVWKGALKW